MESLPSKFLQEIARKYHLSEEQEIVFIKLFSSNSSQQDIADSLHISHSALRTRMTGVYKKFKFNQRSPNKQRLLHDFLLKEYKKNSRVRDAPTTDIQETEIDINGLVNKFREQVKKDIETRCGIMRIFDMSQPIDSEKIYTQVNILEKIIGRRRKEIAELTRNCNLEDGERFNLGIVTEEKILGKDAVSKYKKLFILGKPGAGKTTFLKHLVIQCSRGLFQDELVPFFISLKDFAEAKNKPELLTYLRKYIQNQDEEDLHHILERGKALICLDGLDEVLERDSQRVIKEIRDFSVKFPHNQYVMTCRIAAKEYTFEQFTEVEIADFDWEQITTFAENWFKDKAIKAETFLNRLEKDKPIKELVSNPLLLTLLCISFEELGDFPANRKELYEEGLDALLKKWDAKRDIQRDKVYKPLSVSKKKDLLSNIAWKTFAPGEYFFKRDKAKRYISEYIRNLPGANIDDEALQGDSGIVLDNIEAQHGLLVARAKNIYSFSHLTFQEYFTAREIIIVRQSSDDALQELVSHLFEQRWREVFLLAVAMSPNAEKLVLLMKQKIDGLLAKDHKLQNFLHWLNKKTIEVDIEYQQEDAQKIQNEFKFYANRDQTISRFFYFGLESAFNRNLYLNLNLNRNLYLNRNFYLYLNLNPNLNLNRNLYLNLNRNLNLNLNRNLYLNLNRNLQLAQELDSELYQALLKLKERLPDEKNINDEEFKQWWQDNGKTWSEDFRKVIIKHENIGHDWQFSKEQKTSLEQYYRANQFLTECLHHECYVSPEVRQEIEETLLLPIAEIEKRQSL